MKEIIINTVIKVCSVNELSPSDREIVDAARAATANSYAVYSQFNVGAAVRLADGTVVCGTNQENAAYPSGLCAERVAMFYANSQYPNVAPKALAIATFAGGDFLEEPITPCGACRQVLLESEMRYGEDIDVLLYGRKYIYKISNVKSLLPLAFDEKALK